MRNGPAHLGRGRNWNKVRFEHQPFTISPSPEQRFARTIQVGEAANHVLQRLSEKRRREWKT